MFWLVGFVLASAAWSAQPARRAFDLPADTADAALRKFSQQAGQQILFPSAIVEGVRTNAVKGDFTPLEAANRLLAGTTLFVVADEKTGVLSVERVPAEGREKNGQRAVATVADRPMLLAGQRGDDANPIKLSPFEVKASTTGYLATNTMSGTRLNTSIEDLASSISVVTKQQMADFAMLDINDIFAYEAGTEGVSTYLPFEIDRNGRVADTAMSDRESANRVRGIGAANISRSGFATSGRVPVDPIDIDAVEISRGPNSSIFGLGEGSGTVNMVAASANLNRASSQTQVRFDDTGGWRTSIDLSRPLVPGKLAARVSAVYQHDEYNQKPSAYNTRRLNAMVRAQPFKNTTLRASFQSYLADGTRATVMTPRDGVSYWREIGSPTWDPITQTATINGRSTTLTGTNNPAGLANLNRAGPVLYVDQGGIQLWEISRLPAANATNGPSNTGGVNRLLESIPDPVRDGRPLFSIIRGVSDRSVYDYAHINLSGPNYQREEVATSTVEFEQYLLNTGRNTVAFQFAWQREDADRLRRTTVGSTNPVGTSGIIYVNPNTRMLDGRTNPFYLKPYVGVAEPVWTQTPYERDSYRGQLAYVLDLTKEKSKWLQLLGRQQFLGYYEERKSKNHVYRFRDVMISDHPVYAPAGQPKGAQGAANGFVVSQQATRPYFQYYVGDANGQNVDYAPSRAEAGTYDFRWFDPAGNRWVTDRATFGEAGIPEASAGENANSTLNLIQTKGAILQSTFFQNRLVTTFGRRSDQSGDKRQNRVFLKPNGYEFDYAKMDGWRGDWDIREGDTTSKGAVLRPFRDWRFIETASNGAGWTARLASALQGLGLFYNRSDSFRPAAPAINILQEVLPNPASVGQDYGFTLSLGNKFMFRANHYTTQQINSRAGQGTNIANRTLQVDFADILVTNAFTLQRQARNWITQLNPGVSATDREAQVYKIMGVTANDMEAYRGQTVADTTNIEARGEEYELNFNPSNYWTLRANVTRSESIDGAQSPSNSTWLAQRFRQWESIIDPRTGNKWLATGYAGEFPSATAQTARAYIAENITTPLRIDGATQGTARPQIREWRFNLATSYRLAGISEHRFLRNVTAGGGVRWESKGAIGFYGVPINGRIEAAEQLDPQRPIWDKAHAYFDGFVSYQARFFGDKVRARFQLNVRNIQESHARLQPVGAYPNGQPHTFRIVDPRAFVFTTTFDL
jgi:hypothetical protein